MTWTAEKIEKLIKLWEEGYSASAIGKELGVSKNSVVGKAHRMKLASRPSPIRAKKSDEPAEKKSKATTADRTKVASTAAKVTKSEAKTPPSPKKSVAKEKINPQERPESRNSSTQKEVAQTDIGQNDTGQNDTGQNDTGQNDTGQNDTGHSVKGSATPKKSRESNSHLILDTSRKTTKTNSDTKTKKKTEHKSEQASADAKPHKQKRTPSQKSDDVKKGSEQAPGTQAPGTQTPGTQTTGTQAPATKVDKKSQKTTSKPPKPNPFAQDLFATFKNTSAVRSSKSCLWPIGDPTQPDFHFCDGKAIDGKPYCEKHCSVAYVTKAKPEEAA